MPTNRPNPAYTIGEKQLPPHLQRRFRSKSSMNAQSVNSESYAILFAAETVIQGNAVHCTGSGLVEVADCTAGKPADGFAANSGMQGDQIKVQQCNKIYITDASFEAGEEVWLGSGDVNISTDQPSIESGMILQQVGTAVETNCVLIKISDPFTIE